MCLELVRELLVELLVLLAPLARCLDGRSKSLGEDMRELIPVTAAYDILNRCDGTPSPSKRPRRQRASSLLSALEP
eukprot:4120031-Alexandrium_andersonii.AAC.1